MATFEIERGGRRYEVEAPDAQRALQALDQSGVARGGVRDVTGDSWADYGGGLLRQGLQGLSFGTADEIEASIPGRRRGGEDYSAAVARIRRENERFSQQNPLASFGANLVGGIVPFAGGPLGAAARWAAAGRTMPQTMARSAGLGAGAGGAAGFGAGEGDVLEGDFNRLGSAALGAGLGAGFGAAVPPVVSGIGRMLAPAADVARRSMPRGNVTEPPPSWPAGAPDAQPVGWRPGQPVPRATMVDDRVQGVLNEQEGALQMIVDTMSRAGRTQPEIDAVMARISQAHRLDSNSYAQNVTTLVDAFPELQPLLGSLARSYPEVANDAARFFYARQTGLEPPGADPRALAARGIPTRPRFARPETGTQAGRRLGREFVAQPDETIVPAGAQARTGDASKRMNLLKDTDYHGHAANPERTEAQILASQKATANPAYEQAFTVNENVNLQPVVKAVQDDWLQRRLPAVHATAIRRAASKLYTDGPGGKQLPRTLREFDAIKKDIDDTVSSLFTKNLSNRAGLVTEFKNELIAAVDAATGGEQSLYRAARSMWADDAESLGIMRAYRNLWSGRETPNIRFEAGPNHYATLPTEKQKLARLGLQWGYEDATKGSDFGRQVANVFNNPRVNELIAYLGPRSDKAGAVFANRPERFGQYLDLQNAGTRARDVVLGGSQTAKNIMDDMALGATEAFQSLRSALDTLRGSASVWDMGSRIIERIIDRSFGPSANRAREAGRMLLTADQDEIAAIMARIARMLPPDRMARFTQLMQQVQKNITPSVAGAAGNVGGTPPPTRPPSPTFL